MATQVFDWIRHHANRAPDTTALADIRSDRNWSYSELNHRIDQLTASLQQSLGIERGDRIGVLAENSSDIFEIQFACARLGAVFLPLNWRLTVPELEFIVNDASPKLLFYSRQFEANATAIKNLCGIQELLLLDNGVADSPYENTLAQAPTSYTEATLNQDDLYAILYTSGTTGLPKGAMITHGMVFYNAVNIGGPALITPESKHLSVLPLFHIAGLNIFSNPVFHAGGTVVVTQTFDPAESLSLLSDPAHAFTHFFGVPANYLFISQQSAFSDADLSHLKVCGVGGAPCALSILEAFSPKGVDVQQGYGMTEASPVTHLSSMDPSKARSGSIGKVIPATEVRLIDPESGRDVAQGEDGELWIRGPQIMRGYLKQPEATAQCIDAEGWYHSGDIGYVDDDGFFFIVDRVGELIKYKALQVSPAELEAVLVTHPGVADAAVIPIPDEEAGEIPKGVVVLKDPEATSDEMAESIMAFVADRVAPHKRVRSLDFIDQVPKSASGKILRRVLVDQERGGSG